MRLHNFKIEQTVTEPSFLQNSAKNTLGLVFIVGILICVIPLIIIALTFIVVVLVWNLFFNKNNGQETELEEEGFNTWYPFYENDFIKIYSMEIIPEDEFNNSRWHGPTLLKFKSLPNIELFESTYFKEETFIFLQHINCLFGR